MVEDIRCSYCETWNPKSASKCLFCGKPLPISKDIPPIMQVTPKELIEGIRRKTMQEKEEKAPKVIGADIYICPECLKENLSYNEDERLFICSNPECGRKFALKEI